MTMSNHASEPLPGSGSPAWSASELTVRRAAPAEEPELDILQEITLGAHVLFILSDQSLDLFANEPASAGVQHGLHLDSLEAYRLLLCLHEVFQPTRVPRAGQEAPGRTELPGSQRGGPHDA